MKSQSFQDRYDSNSVKGFSLIEILIVIAIMAILFAVMMPNLLSSRRRAHDTSTIHYLRAVAIKQADYYIDNHSYAANQTLISELPTNSDTVIESWQGNVLDFCVQAKHPRGSSYKVTADSRIFEGTCG